MMTKKTVYLVLLLVSVMPAQQHTATPPFSIHIEPSQPEFKVGDPVVVRTTLENTSTDDIRLVYANSPQGHAEMTFKVDVLDGFGHRAPRTKYGRTLRNEDDNGGPFNSFSKRVLKPHENISDSVNISDLYELSKPGQYIVQLEKEYMDKDVASNAIKIIIRPKTDNAKQ